MSSRVAVDARLAITGSQFKTICVGVATALWAGMAVVFPLAALPPLGLVAAGLLLISPVFRLAFILVGGMLVLNTTQDFGLIKVVYLLGAGLGVTGAGLNIIRSESRTKSDFTVLVGTGLLFSAVVGFALLVAALNGTPATQSLRDAAPYLLFSVVPILALDAEAAVPEKLLIALLVSTGILSASSFAIEFLARRNYADISFRHLAFESLLLPAALFSYAVAAALRGKRFRLAWTAVAACVFTLFLVTGTRTSLLLLVAPSVILIAGRGDLILRSIRALAYGLIAFGLVALFAQAAVSLTGADISSVSDRFRSVFELLIAPVGDWSFRERLQQTSEAWSVFVSSPLLGVGPGHLFQGRAATTDLEIATFNIDTGMSFPAKFGMIGMGAALLMAIALVRLLWSGRRTAGSSVASLTIVAYSAVVLAFSILSSPFEDKGLSFGMVLLLSLYAIARRHSSGPDRPSLTPASRPGE